MAKRKKDKGANGNLQSTMHRTPKDRAKRTPLLTGTVSSSYTTSGTHPVILVANPVIRHE